MEIISSLEIVDEVVVQSHRDKIKQFHDIGFDVMFVGDDWKGDPIFIELEKELLKFGACIEYFEYTQLVSSTKFTKILQDIYDLEKNKMKFTYKKWENFCSEASLNFNCIMVKDIPHQKSKTPWLSIKHDVETNVKKAFELAKIEKKYGISATYFFQSYLIKDNLELLNKIAELGHEVTYHYDVLDRNNGNFDLALKEFTDTLKIFEKNGFEVKSVCPHGNPLMIRNGWSSNKDFFRNNKIANLFPKIFDVVVHASKVIDNDFLYVSDAGYSWKLIGNIDSNDLVNNGDTEINSSKEVIELIHTYSNAIVSTHPHRWQKNKFLAFFMKLSLNQFDFRQDFYQEYQF